jgi:hypothetical protein
MMDDRENRTREYASGAVTETGSPSWQSQAAGAGVHDYCHFITLRSDGLKPLCIFHKSRLNT